MLPGGAVSIVRLTIIRINKAYHTHHAPLSTLGSWLAGARWLAGCAWAAQTQSQPVVSADGRTAAGTWPTAKRTEGPTLRRSGLAARVLPVH